MDRITQWHGLFDGERCAMKRVSQHGVVFSVLCDLSPMTFSFA